MTPFRWALIGANISRSRMPSALEILCDHVGLPFEGRLIDASAHAGFSFEDKVAELREAGLDGINVTHPFKEDAFALMARDMRLEDRGMGAANTIRLGERPEAANTDFSGFVRAFETAGFQPMTPGAVVMVGAGGVARAIGTALIRLGVSDLAIHDVENDRAEVLAKALGPEARAIGAAELDAAVMAADGLINATPMGMVEHPGSAIDAILIDAQSWAFDAVYRPVWTPFLKAAQRRGLATLTGFDLFVHMALDSFAHLTGNTLDIPEALPLLTGLEPIGDANAA